MKELRKAKGAHDAALTGLVAVLERGTKRQRQRAWNHWRKCVFELEEQLLKHHNPRS